MSTLEQQQLEFEIQITKKWGVFPAARYQGSKYKLLNWIKYHVKDLKYETVLDVFGGTGSVSYLFKQLGKAVIYNDYLKFNTTIATALIENNSIVLSEEKVEFLLQNQPNVFYPTFIHDTFENINYTNEENQWLDKIITNINLLDDKFERAIAYFAVFQSCIAKRPYNLFHRKNLYIRMADINRSFGNKKTWDTPFEDMFRKFVREANHAIFDNDNQNNVLNHDASNLKLTVKPDLVYIDPPYLSNKGQGVNYHDFYHFLEGLTDYSSWGSKIDNTSKHLKLQNKKNVWDSKSTIYKAFQDLFEKFKDSIIVVSYRDDGIPSIAELTQMLENLGKEVKINQADYKYVFSKANSKEVLIIAI